MRKLLTGVCNNIAQYKDQIVLWKQSFENVTNGDVVLIAHNATPEDINTLEDIGIKYLSVSTHSSETVNNSRLSMASDFFRHHAKFYDICLYTDVFDVAFQRDPFAKLETDKYDIFVAGEGVTHNCEPWNMDVLQKCFPAYVNDLRNKEIYCSGVIAGKPEKLSQWFLDMVKITLTSKKGHNIEDQAAMNCLISQNEKYRVKYFNLTDNWCIHLAVAGPTQFFEGWGFKQRIKDRYNIVPDWRNYDIVHQFNRIPNIHEQIKQLI